MIQQKNKTKGT